MFEDTCGVTFVSRIKMFDGFWHKFNFPVRHSNSKSVYKLTTSSVWYSGLLCGLCLYAIWPRATQYHPKQQQYSIYNTKLIVWVCVFALGARIHPKHIVIVDAAAIAADTATIINPGILIGIFIYNNVWVCIDACMVLHCVTKLRIDPECIPAI